MISGSQHEADTFILGYGFWFGILRALCCVIFRAFSGVDERLGLFFLGKLI